MADDEDKPEPLTGEVIPKPKRVEEAPLGSTRYAAKPKKKFPGTQSKGRRGMGRPKGSQNIAPKVRGHFLRAVAGLEDRGKGLTVLLEDAMLADVNATLHAIARFVPREHLVDAHISTSIIDVLSKYGGTEGDPEVEEDSGDFRH